MLTHALYDKSASRSIVYLASVCDLTQRASVSMRKCADWVNLKFVYARDQTASILPTSISINTYTLTSLFTIILDTILIFFIFISDFFVFI